MNKAEIKPKIVYHYCSLDTFYAIFSNSTIRLSNISKSNDSQEITFLIPEMKDYCVDLFSKYNKKFTNDYQLKIDFIEKLFDLKFDQMSLNFYTICFSEEPDLLSQWRGYANDACGVSIGFSTEPFYTLARSFRSSYTFSQVKYSLNDLYDKIKNYVIKKTNENFIGEEKNDSSELLNIADTAVSMLFYNSILYKNPNFYEEKEWRLIYNPFGNIRPTQDKYSYYDRMYEIFSPSYERGNFIRNPMAFHISNDKIISHIDLSFSSIKNDLIKENIIGSKANINDLDLELFLLSNGFNPLKININKSHIPYR